MRLALTLVGCLTLMQALAQIAQPARWERELKFSEESYSLVSMKEEGIALLRSLDEYEHNKRKWELTLLDTLLQETWSTKLSIDGDYTFLGYEHTPSRLNLMFRQSEAIQLNAVVIDVDLQSKEVQTSTVEFKLQIRLTHYTVAGRNCFFGGYVGMEPVLLVFDPIKKKNLIVPGFFLTETELLDVRPNNNSTVNVLLAQRISGKKKLIFRTFDKNGSILIEDEIPIDEGKTILSGASSVLEHDEVLIAGSFAFNNNKQASGIFSCLIDPFGEQPVQYTEFHQLQHFLDYLSDKKASKIRQRATQREGYGKNPEYKTNITIHRIEEFNDGFALFGESYLSSTSANNNYAYSNPYGNPYARTGGTPYPYYSTMGSRYYNNPYLYQTSTVSTDIRIVQAFTIGFSFKGNRVWDYTAPMGDLKAYTREQVSDFVVAADGIPHFLYKEENDLKFSNHGTDTLQTLEPKAIPIRLNNAFEESRPVDDQEGHVRQWYADNFYVWGVTNIKDSRPAIPNRRVFFINKVALQE